MDALNKNRLLLAIENYSLFNNSQKKVLSTMVSLESNGEVFLNSAILARLTKLNKVSVYQALSFLIEQNFLTKEPGIKKMVLFRLNAAKLDEIIDWYIKIQNFVAANK